MPVPFKQAITLGKRGRPKKGEEKTLSDKVYGVSSAYLEARLRRDHPEILAAKERGGARACRLIRKLETAEAEDADGEGGC